MNDGPIGVLGGMGPLATADFYRKVIEATPAERDADHVPLIIYSVPQIPERVPAVLGHGESPLPALLVARDTLLRAGVGAIVMPCNTAHHWHAALLEGCPVPFPHIADTACAELASRATPGDAIGIVGTAATLALRIYDARLEALGYRPLLPTERELDDRIMPAIALVKAGQPVEAGALIAPAIAALLDRGAKAVILGCTETPVAVDAVNPPFAPRCIDATAALARACVRWWRERAGAPSPSSALERSAA